MATAAHCAYCFEILAADLENREPLKYSQVQDLWKQYDALNKFKAVDTGKGDEPGSQLPGGEGIEDVDIETDDAEEIEDEDEDEQPEEIVAPQPKHSKLSLPSITRLQASSPSSGSSTSTPSSLSTSSSRAALGDASKSSSKTSFFSCGSRRSQQPSPAALSKEGDHPLFVTWNTVSHRSGHKSLRGCIGTFDAQELSAGLKSYALTAAFDDHRFPPISYSELPTLSISVTLLTNFTPVSYALDWDLGTHGIRISFSSHGKRYGATYLPDVAVEQGWTKEETIVSLMRKAGWQGRSNEWREVKELGVVRYEGYKATLGWLEWRGWREWVDGPKN